MLNTGMRGLNRIAGPANCDDVVACHIPVVNPASTKVPAMTLRPEARHDLTPNEIDAIEDRLYEHNSHATGRRDGQGLGFIIRDNAGQIIGGAAGYTWAGISELKQMWVDKAYRGRGYARALLEAFVEEARARNAHRIWVASYDFQSPEMYEKAGFKRMAEFEGWPEGHVNVIFCKTL
jgi:GNAT superfamily N-acetyltransferase